MRRTTRSASVVASSASSLSEFAERQKQIEAKKAELHQKQPESPQQQHERYILDLTGVEPMPDTHTHGKNVFETNSFALNFTGIPDPFEVERQPEREVIQ